MHIDTRSRIRVMLAEDSPSVRELLAFIVNSDASMQIIGVANDGEQAIALAQRLKPDVILMDIHMPKMDGFSATRKIMELCPTRIVMVTATSIPDDVAATFQALESGALTVLAKPTGLGHGEHRRLADELLQTVRLMSEVQVVRRWSHPASTPAEPARLPALAKAAVERHFRAIGMGASTGGPVVLRDILSRLPADLEAPILIVQHISSGFTDGFIDWLGKATGYPVQAARHGESAVPGVAYVAPDDRHLSLRADGTMNLQASAQEHGMRPAVSCLFRSLADNFGAAAIGVLLTGMGRDGADELQRMQQAGAVTIAQDEESSVVYGMPGEAIKLNAATHILKPEAIASTVTQLLKQGRSAPLEGEDEHG